MSLPRPAPGPKSPERAHKRTPPAEAPATHLARPGALPIRPFTSELLRALAGAPLSRSALRVGLALVAHAGADYLCWPSLETLSRIARLCVPRVRLALAELERVGLTRHGTVGDGYARPERPHDQGPQAFRGGPSRVVRWDLAPLVQELARAADGRPSPPARRRQEHGSSDRLSIARSTDRVIDSRSLDPGSSDRLSIARSAPTLLSEDPGLTQKRGAPALRSARAERPNGPEPRARAREADPRSRAPSHALARAFEVLELWSDAAGESRRNAYPKQWLDLVEARFREGFETWEMQQALRGMRLDPWTAERPAYRTLPSVVFRAEQLAELARLARDDDKRQTARKRLEAREARERAAAAPASPEDAARYAARLLRTLDTTSTQTPKQHTKPKGPKP